MNEIKLLNIDTAMDDRGYLNFCNDFDLSKYVRFYDVFNYQINFIRAWHGHKFETKAAMIKQGSAMICVVKVDDWINPSKTLKIHKFFLSTTSPKILVIPKGHAHGFLTLEEKTNITFFSDKNLKDSINDDFRFDYNYWDPWRISFR